MSAAPPCPQDPPTPATPSTQPALKRALRFRDLALFYIVSGLSVRWVATAAAAGPSTLAVWLLALVGFFIPLAASVLELSSRYPAEGGLYVWAREAYGDFSGFIAAWTYMMSNLPYFPAVLYFGAGSVLFAFGARGQHFSSSSAYFLIFALGWLAFITLMNIIGVDAGKWLNNACTLGSIVPISILIVLAVISARHFGSATSFAPHELIPRPSLSNAIFWSTIFFAFGGCEAGSFMGEEIENPRRTIPRALLVGGTILAVGYIAGTIALLVALPSNVVHGVDGFMRGMMTLCTRLNLVWLAAPVALLLGLNAVGGAAAYLSSTSRLPFVAGIDCYFPPVFGHIHPRFKTPWVAIGTSGVAGMIVALLSQAGTSVRGAYDVLVSMSIIAYFIPYLFLFASMIRLQNRPAGPDVIRVWGGRPVATTLAVIGLLSTALTIVLSVIPGEDEPNKLLAVAKVLISTAILIGIGVAIFLRAERKRTRIEPHPDFE
ncbi:MAG TPA: APC family permease [Silvibacterium sp.]|jgi:amino acid transporter|nr:APC family permease [Silvibacterium sp.]